MAEVVMTESRETRPPRHAGRACPRGLFIGGRETRSDSDYVSHLSGISSIKRVVASKQEIPDKRKIWSHSLPIFLLSGMTGWGRRGRDGHGDCRL